METEDAAVQARFQVQHMLGRGAYGTVWKALDKVTNQPVAIKVIPLVDTDKEELQAIQREIKFLAGCDHPNVVKYLGSCRHHHELWIIMEYCGGGSVSDLLTASQRPIPEAAVAYICSEALKGLTYLHSLSKVHRDIKCGNILLTETGSVKLADFGVAAQLTATMSKRQTFIGTPHWMAPEVIQESRYDGKVDVWALGISAIEMAELTPPRWAVHPMRVIFMISRDPPPRLTQAPDQWSLLFHDFLEQCLTKEPKSRPTARLLLQHRFVLQAQATGTGLSELLPLIDLSMQYLAHAAASADTPSGQGGVLEMAAQATGHFSWRNVPAQGGTVLAGARPDRQAVPAVPALPATPPAAPSHPEPSEDALGTPRMPEPSESPAAVGLGARGPRVRMGPVGIQGAPAGALHVSDVPGLRDSGPTNTSQHGGAYDTTVVKEDYGGTVVVHAGDTLKPHPRPERESEGGVQDTLLSPESLPSAFNTAQPGAPRQEETTGGGYRAAVRAAAAEAQRERERAHASALASPQAAVDVASVPHAHHKDEPARTVERLHAIYESGLVVTTPFLPATHAQSMALLSPIGGASAHEADVIQGLDGTVYRTLAALVAENAALGGDAASKDSVWLDQGLVPPPPPHLLDRVYMQPQLQNGLRTLAFHMAALASLPLGAAAATELQQSVEDVSQALSTMLMSG